MRLRGRLDTMAVLLAGVLVAAACGGASIPEPPLEYTTAMAELESAVADGDGYEIEYHAFAVSEALIGFRDTPGVPLPMRADLDRLSHDIAAFGATAATSGFHASHWTDLHSRIDRVVQGQSPTEGPRFESQFPPEVVESVNTIDAALAEGDMATAGDAMWTLNGAFWEWLDVAPPQVAQNAYEVAEQIDVLVYSLDGMSAEEARTQWESIRSRLRI